MKKYSLLIVLFLITALITRAENYNLDLAKSIELAKEKSLSMQGLIQDFKIAEYDLKHATSKLKTHADIDMDLPNYVNRVSEFNTDTSTTLFTRKALTAGGKLTITQPLPTDGSISLVTGLYSEDKYNENHNYSNFYSSLQFTQPLTALYGYNNVLSTLKKSRLAYDQTKKILKREELYLVFQVSNLFYNLLSLQKTTELAKQDLERQKEAYDISQNKFSAGLIKEVDALQMEVDLAEANNNYNLAIVNQSSALNSFKEIVGLNFNDSVTLSTEFKYEIIIVDVEKAVKYALENRFEISEKEIQIEQNKLDLKQNKSNGMIQSSLNVSLIKEGISYLPVNTPYKNSINNMYNDILQRQPGYEIGLKVKIPILDYGENRALVNKAKAQLKKTEIQKEEVCRSIEREVRNLVADLNSSLKRLQLLEKNVVVAEKSFEITRQRFADGDIDSQALALERNRLNTAYNNHLRSYIDYQLMLSDITRKTFYDFKKNEVIK